VRPLIGGLLVVGIASVATATTVALRDEVPRQSPQESRRAGPDSARVAALLASLSRADPVACEMIADQIGNFWWSDGGSGVGMFGDVRADARRGKDSLSAPVSDARAIRLLTATLANDDACVRLVAAKMLGNSAAPDEVIAASLESPAARVREAALRAAGERDRRALRPRVERMLADEPDVAAMAAWTLGEYEQKASVPALRRALAHASPRVRTSAAWALGQVEDPAAAEDLERLVARDDDRRVKLAAVRALGSLESPRSVPTLARAAESADVELRYAALEALLEMTHDDETLVPLFLGFVADPDAEVRERVIHALGEIGAVEAVPALKRALEDPHPEVRRAAVEALAEIDDR
jgi:HEAT repeat protein